MSWDNDKWATPPWVVRWAAAKLGIDAFELDVCAEPHTAKAPRFFTAEDNGLVQPWNAKFVWCNPPYSDPGPWCAKALRAVKEARSVEIAALLLPAATDTVWFHDFVSRKASELYFLRPRIKFLGPDGQPGGSPRGANVLALYRRAGTLSTCFFETLDPEEWTS